jgi:putative endonuclease
VLATNWRCAAGELDLVCRRGRMVVVCEVKARSSSRFGAPEEAVGPAKQRRLRRVAACYLTDQALRAARLRFDVATVLDGELQVIEDAF